MQRWAWFAVSVLVAGCTSPNPRYCGDGVCNDPRYPFCDVDGSIAGTPNTCIEGQCSPSAVIGCQGSDLVTCNANGTNFETTPCEFGCQASECNACSPGTSTCNGSSLEHCGDDGEIERVETCAAGCIEELGRCAYIVPRYVENACDSRANEAELIITSSASFDTSLDSNCNGGIIAQAGAAELCVVRYQVIRIEAGVDLTVVGRRALALVSDDETAIAGYLDLSVPPPVEGALGDGPGGGTMVNGGAASEMCGGLGGAGFATAGGDGGNSAADGGANNGGAAMSDPALLSVLVGGPRSVGVVDLGGAGGGAATLVSCRGLVTVSGEINAAGGGGGSFFGGGGGGAGGYVVLQGANVQVTGKLFANGGGGGPGAFQGIIAPGGEGTRDLVNNNGGAPTPGGAAGGDGGKAGSVLPGSGGRKPGGPGCTGIGVGGGGGGGGSVGFFQTYTPVGIEPTITPSMASPIPQPNANVPTR